MKQPTLLIYLLCIVSSSFCHAQTSVGGPIFSHSSPHAQQILSQQYAQQSRSAKKGTAQRERLIGYSMYFAEMASTIRLVDSVYYKYNSHTMGSELDNRSLNTYVDFIYEPILPITPYPANAIHYSNIPPATKPSISYDSAYRTVYNVGWPNFTQQSSRAYTSGLLTHQTVQSIDSYSIPSLLSTDHYIYDYDTAGKLVYAHFSPHNPNMTDDYTLHRKYDGSRVIKDSLPHQFRSPKQVDYSYDNTGKLIMIESYGLRNGVWQVVMRERYTYNNSNQLFTNMKEIYLSGVLQRDNIDTFLYQGNNIVYGSSHYNWDDSSQSWTRAIISNNYYNTSGNLDSQLTEGSTATRRWPETRTIYTYTTRDHYTQIKSYKHDGYRYSITPSHIYNFYYETHDPTSIPATSNHSLNGFIYPNPAKEILFISLKEMPASPVNISVYNTAGQLQQSAVLLKTPYFLPIANLTPGIYIISLSSKEGSLQTQFVKD